MTAQTPAGVTVTVMPKLAGTSNYGATLLYGEMPVAAYWGSDKRTNTLAAALVIADRYIDEHGLYA